MVCPVGMDKIYPQIQGSNYPDVIRHEAFMMPAKVLVAAAE
jgi:hypothetical protein